MSAAGWHWKRILGFWIAVAALSAVEGAAVSDETGKREQPPKVSWTPFDPPCAGGRSGSKAWRAVTARDRIKAVFATAQLLPAKDLGEGTPTKCQLRIRERCAPDLDGDGHSDALYRVEWFVPTNPEDMRCPAPKVEQLGDPNVVVMLLRSNAKVPDLLGSDWGGRRTVNVGFGRLTSGKTVLIVDEQMSESDTDCSVDTIHVIDASQSPVQELSVSSERSGCPNGP
jgi:hypothetical protein